MKTISTKKLIEVLETKIIYNELLIKGQLNDGDHDAAHGTTMINQGYREALEIAKTKRKNKITKKVVKNAEHYLSVGTLSTIEMIKLIELSFDEANESDEYIEMIEGVEVLENFEFQFVPMFFLRLIGLIK